VFCPVVYGWGRRAGLQSSDAKDIVQDVFRAVATSIDSFERSSPNASFRGWLWTVTQNKVRDHFRHAVNRPQAIGGSEARAQVENLPAPTTTSAAENSAVLGHATKAVLGVVQAEFETRTWQAFWQVVVDQRRPSDVAASLGMNVSAVYMAKSRVLHRLRDELRGLCGDDPSDNSQS
jgi:RNA polymerase sigma-70 factor (ECF subfamily)